MGSYGSCVFGGEYLTQQPGAGSAAVAGIRNTLQVQQLGTDTANWERFVDQCPQATFFHRVGWRTVIQTVFQHPSYYLYAESPEGIQGVLPLVHINSRIFGNALVSNPFCVYGGIAATTENAAEALTNAACKLADSLAVDYLEMRHLDRRNPGWPVKDALYVTFRKSLDRDPEANLRTIPRKQRAMVRKGIQANLCTELNGDVERLYAAYSESVRNLGTPVLPKRYFRALKDVFGDDCEVLTVTRQGQTLAAVMSFYFRDQVLPYYGGGTEQARHYKANDFMYWDVMRRASERGILVFDYGRSKVGTGSYSFKKNWGFKPEPLFYEYYLVRAKALPDINPLNPKYRLFIQLWKRLPLPLSQFLGPYLARSLG